MRKLSIVLTVLLSVLLAFVACDNSIDIGLNTKVEVKEIRLNQTELEISTGEEATLVATVLPEDATDKSVTWSSSDPKVAKVDANGKVTGVGAGEATITATSNSDNTVTETCSVKVTVDPYKIPLTLEFLAEGELSITTKGGYGPCDVYYSLNGGEKTLFEVGTSVSVYKDYVVSLYRDVSGAKVSSPYFTVNCTSDCYVYGNVMSLIDSDDFATADEVYATFLGLFMGNQHITNHPTIDIILPATTLAEGCYSAMFYGCKGLTRAPELPATQLAERCYYWMFTGCTSLKKAPELPAETLADYCYYHMFYGCSSLTTAPVLPAETLADYCYSQMFSGCTSLTTAPNLPAEQLANSCYSFMFEECKSLTTAPDLPVEELAETCYEGMFSDCIRLETAPELPATTLADYCYKEMFAGCTSLTTAPELPATTLADYCYYYMFNGCSSLNSITCLATIAPDDCTDSWVEGVATTGTFYKNPNATCWTVGSNVPSGWTITDYGPTT